MMKKILVTVIILLFCFAGCATMEKEKFDYIRGISFSPDGKKIIFDRRKNSDDYVINVYDLDMGELNAYRSPVGEQWADGHYSYDGGKIVFTITPHNIGEKWDISKAQLAIMEPDGKNVRKITSSLGWKLYPSFSHDGKKIIYIQAGKVRKEGKTPATDFDIYEVDLETGNETRLSWFKFYMMSAPYYFPDDERIIFSAFGVPSMFPDIEENDHEAIRKKQKELDAKSLHFSKKLGDNIYVIKKGRKELPGPLIFSKADFRSPLLTKDGTIFFEKIVSKPELKHFSAQYFQYSADGAHRCIVDLNTPSVWSSAVSNDGALLAIVLNTDSGNGNKILIYKVKDGTGREITLPDQPSRIINGQ